MADQPIKYNSQIEKDEHDDSANIGGKRVILFAWNSSTLAYERVTSTGGVLNVSGGGSGGGAATIADGADVTQGALADVAVVGDNSGTVSAKLRGLNKNIASALTDLDTIVTNTNKIISAPATSAKQDTGNTSLASIDTKTPALGQALAAASIPVILPSATITTLTPPAAITNFANETGGNLAAIKTDVDKIPSQGQALAAGSMPVVLPATQITTLTPPTNTGYALDSSLTNVVTLGAKTDAKSTATDGTSVSIMAVLKEISAMEQTPPSTPVTGTFWQATQPISQVAPTIVKNGKTTVTTAGTRVALASTTAIKSVTVKALSTNTGLIYVGDTSVASTNGFQLSAGESVSLDLADPSTVNIDSSVNGEGVTYITVN